jgi:hypothetical protein
MCLTRQNRIRRRTGWALLALLVSSGCVVGWHHISRGDEPSDSKGTDSAEIEETARLIKAELPNWKIWKGSSRQVELKLEPKSVLRWSNPGTGRVFGDLFIWTAAGRPEVAMSLFKTWEPAYGFHTELHSLSLVALESERDGVADWRPTQPGITLRDVPGATPPGDTAVKRLLQMRAIAGEFNAVLTDYRLAAAGELQPLRMLTQPLYRYQSTDPELLDGALFGFVLGTDPEVFLLLEARRDGENGRWQFGLARMNNDSLAVMHKDREVWRIGRVESQDGLRDPYVLKRVPEAPK